MTTPTPPTPRPRNYALWAIAILLFLLLICGACTLLSLTPLGDSFWAGFMQGLSR